MEKEYYELLARYNNSQEATCKISRSLDALDIDYALFKSVRPYRETTVDIDIIIFDSIYQYVAAKLRDAGYRILEKGPLTITLRDLNSGINVDLYNEIGVSKLIYLDKCVLRDFVEERRLLNGICVQSLSPEADLLALITHSIIKENMYVLSEYLTTLHYLVTMREKQLESFITMSKESHSWFSLTTHLTITALLHRLLYGYIPRPLAVLLMEIAEGSVESSRVADAGLKMPHKYHPLTLFGAIREKLPERKVRRSLVSQFSYLLNPFSGQSVLLKAVEHVFRESY